ncbi:MAG: hypothetical protein AYP45_03545 [Candidatus Brocadia carolinensis]|uniref:Uncharacterized protein n=1 Tax=Candidatus Brocadia carolinensis TaxID=1004156 RepID=A0A1V4AW97_9BACT|nr:MAG: hypothetical protein AYP45_03545 [Candidatus Brocadia caroliniensis]
MFYCLTSLWDSIIFCPSLQHDEALLQDWARNGRISKGFEGILRKKTPKRRFVFSMKTIAQTGERKQPKIRTEMSGKRLAVHAGLSPVLTFMGNLLFRQGIQDAVGKEREANAQYQMVDAMQMVVIGLIAGATSMVQITKVWADDVLIKIAGWRRIPVDTTIGRMMKLVTQGDIVELTGVIHRFRGQVWKRVVRSGHKLRSALSDM